MYKSQMTLYSQINPMSHLYTCADGGLFGQLYKMMQKKPD